jgi:hypothetical protein
MVSGKCPGIEKNRRKNMKGLVLTLLLLVPASASSQSTTPDAVIINGTCDPKSGVTINDGEKSDFACDTAVVMRSSQGTVLIQFTDKQGDDGRILGFAAIIEGKQGFGADDTQMLAVQRIYLAGGSIPIPASRGTCIMNWSGLQRTGGKLTSVLCAARGEAEGTDIQAVAVLKAQ